MKRNQRSRRLTYAAFPAVVVVLAGCHVRQQSLTRRPPAAIGRWAEIVVPIALGLLIALVTTLIVWGTGRSADRGGYISSSGPTTAAAGLALLASVLATVFVIAAATGWTILNPLPSRSAQLLQVAAIKDPGASLFVIVYLAMTAGLAAVFTTLAVGVRTDRRWARIGSFVSMPLALILLVPAVFVPLIPRLSEPAWVRLTIPGGEVVTWGAVFSLLAGPVIVLVGLIDRR